MAAFRCHESSWYGPVPSLWVANHLPAHLSDALLWLLMAWALTIGSFGSLPRKYTSGCFSLITSVVAPFAAIDATLVISVAGPWFTPWMRSRPSFAPAALNAEPSWNLT